MLYSLMTFMGNKFKVKRTTDKLGRVLECFLKMGFNHVKTGFLQLEPLVIVIVCN